MLRITNDFNAGFSPYSLPPLICLDRLLLGASVGDIDDLERCLAKKGVEVSFYGKIFVDSYIYRDMRFVKGVVFIKTYPGASSALACRPYRSL